MIYVRFDTNTDVADARNQLNKAADAFGATGHYESEDLLEFMVNAIWNREMRVLPLYRSSLVADPERMAWLINGVGEHLRYRLQAKLERAYPFEQRNTKEE